MLYLEKQQNEEVRAVRAATKMFSYYLKDITIVVVLATK